MNSLSFHWWSYPESADAASFPIITSDNSAIASVTLPKDDRAGEYHVILEVSDNGSPPLTAYRRIIIHAQR